ncbi:MAG TPA: hypothetical protein DCP71_16535 [Verrucomicrobiales bacterium]|nr:hypothetical protein [Verrucomicrobiales bacterium]
MGFSIGSFQSRTADRKIWDNDVFVRSSGGRHGKKGLPLNSLSGSAGFADKVRDHGLNIAELKLSKRLGLVAILPNAQASKSSLGDTPFI